MVKLEWGTKRTCQNCGARFYDLRSTPIKCPKCDTVFEIQTSTRGKRGRAALDLEKEIPTILDDVALISEIDLTEDLDDEIEEDDSLIEDTSDLGEDLDDIPDVLDHGGDAEDI